MRLILKAPIKQLLSFLWDEDIFSSTGNKRKQSHVSPTHKQNRAGASQHHFLTPASKPPLKQVSKP